VGPADGLLAIRHAARTGERVQAAAGGEVLQRRRLRELVARLGCAVGEVRADDLVAQLRGRARRAAVDPAVDDDAAADPGADREHHEVAGERGPVVGVGLGERGAGGVVVDVHGHAQTLAQRRAQRDARERDVHAEAGRARGEVDGAGHRDPDRVGGTRGLDGGDELVEELLLGVAVRGRGPDLVQHRALERRHRDLGPTHVDTDEALSHGSFLSDSA
jgi:hypothetical protein